MITVSAGIFKNTCIQLERIGLNTLFKQAFIKYQRENIERSFAKAKSQGDLFAAFKEAFVQQNEGLSMLDYQRDYNKFSLYGPSKWIIAMISSNTSWEQMELIEQKIIKPF